MQFPGSRQVVSMPVRIPLTNKVFVKQDIKVEMIRIPNSTQAAELKASLRRAGYVRESLEQHLQMPMPPGPGDYQVLEERTRQQTAVNALIRLFVLGLALPAGDTKQLVATELIDLCLELALLRAADGLLVPGVCLLPVGDFLLASDVVGKLTSDDASEFVLPANTHSAAYLNRCVPRESVEATLDLGCGCGIHALFAAGHSGSVIATDINPAAVAYTKFNAALNGVDNVAALEGDLFEPVAGQLFDLIISNPPFVLTPESSFSYRGNPMNLDDFCRMLVGEAAGYLRDQGQLVMLGEWVSKGNVAWADDRQSWLGKAVGCDALLLRNPPVSTSRYVEQRMTDSSPTVAEEKHQWLTYLESQHVTAINPCVVLLRKNPGGENWTKELLLRGETGSKAGADIARVFEGEDLLLACADNESLLLATLQLSENVQVLEEAGPSGHPTHARLGLSGGLPLEAEVEVAVLAFLAELDGKTTLDRCIDRFCAKVNADRRLVAGDLVTAVRTFVSRAFVVPADLDA